MQYDIYFNNCSAIDKSVYWVGSTTELFGLPSDRHVLSDISVQPTTLTMQWIYDNFDINNRFVFNNNSSQYVKANSGDVHTLIVVPNQELDIDGIFESVIGQLIDMDYGTHYSSMVMPDNPDYTCFYIRDLTTESFYQDRLFQFNIISN
jgi:hypothetical protein